MTNKLTPAVFIALSISCAVAQTRTPAAVYRLQFRFEEARGEAAAQNSHYSLLIQSGARAKAHVAQRLPYYTSVKGDAKELHTAAVGNIVECMADERESGVHLNCSFESNYVPPAEAAKSVAFGFLPVVYARQASVTAIIPAGPEVRLARLDDPSRRSRVEVFVTVERYEGRQL